MKIDRTAWCRFLYSSKPLICAGLFVALATSEMGAAAPYDRIYVFGDSYSDIGAGYLDGNGPTAVAYLAERLGIPLLPSNDPNAAGRA